jgi:uncharacterized protein with PQ loop repeat
MNFKLLLFHDLLWYCHMTNEIIQIVIYGNFDSFQHLNFIFSWKFISLIERLLARMLVLPTYVTIWKRKKSSSCACMMIPNVGSSLYLFFSLLFHFFSSSYWLVSFFHDHIELMSQFFYSIAQASIPCNHIELLFQFIIELVFQFSHKKHKHKFHNINTMNIKNT